MHEIKGNDVYQNGKRLTAAEAFRYGHHIGYNEAHLDAKCAQREVSSLEPMEDAPYGNDEMWKDEVDDWDRGSHYAGDPRSDGWSPGKLT